MGEDARSVIKLQVECVIFMEIGTEMWSGSSFDVKLNNQFQNNFSLQEHQRKFAVLYFILVSGCLFTVTVVGGRSPFPHSRFTVWSPKAWFAQGVS